MNALRGLPLTPFGLGTAALVLPYGAPDAEREPPGRAAAAAAIEAALAAGIAFIDTAPAYDGAEALVGEVTAGAPCVIATKLALGPVRASVEASLTKLRRDRIDLLQIHNATPALLRTDVVDAMEDLRGEQLLTAGSQTHNQPTTSGQSVSATPMEVIDAASRGPVAANTADADGGSLKDVQTGAIRSALQQYGGNVSAAARALGVSRNTIYRALRTIDCSGTEQAAARADTTAQNQNRAS